MRKMQKRQVEELIKLLDRAHVEIKKSLKNNKRSLALDLLEQSQETAIEVGTIIEQSEGEKLPVISMLENYCEQIYQVYQEVDREAPVHADKVYRSLGQSMVQIESSIKNDIKVNTEVVFLPYKASMWDSLESIWKAADEDPDCNAYVIPIPYYEKNQDGSVGEEHYEGDLFPEYVPVTQYTEYDLKERRPDVIFFHNPYDQYNKVTCVHPYFFSRNIKEYTDRLIYVPYYVVPGLVPEHFILTPGVVNADVVFVQNERNRAQYIKILTENIYRQEYKPLNEKVVAIGSPKTDRFFNHQPSESEIPDEWRQMIGNRKVCFFNTNVSLLLNNNDYFVENLDRIFRIFEMYKNDFVLLWREHPLTMETLKSMKPELEDDYLKCRKRFQESNLGILDMTPDPHLAMEISDCYFGAGGSLVTIYSVTGKPMMITAYGYPSGISEERITKENFYNSIQNRTYYKEEHVNSLQLFLDNFDEISTFKEHRLMVIARCMDNLDGSVGEKIYRHITEEIHQ